VKILLIAPWVPWPPFDGGRIRILQTLRYLSRHHEVTLAAPLRSRTDAEGTDQLREFAECVVTAALPGGGWPAARRVVRGALRRWPAIQSVHYSPALAARVRQLTAMVPYDIVQIEFSLFAPYRAAIDAASPARTVLSMHNLETRRFQREVRNCASTVPRRLALGWDRLLAPAWEEHAVRTFDGVAAVSEVERRWIERVAPSSIVEVVPNGVDTDHFRPASAPTTPLSLVFTGAMNYPPNIEAAIWFCRQVWPVLRRQWPGLRFHIVGRAPTASVRRLDGRDGVRVVGEVADVRPYLAQATAVVVPLRAGAGTRLKILEAMAMGRPVISTALGAEGLEVSDGVDIVLADTAAEFAHAVLGVLRSPELAGRIGAAGHRLAGAKYDWQRCLRPLDALYGRVLAGWRRREVAAAVASHGRRARL
jgi:polysaccharide biosynthesis protein PslH